MIPEGAALTTQSFSQSPPLLYHQFQMRRALSILLVLFFGLGPLAATLGAEEDTSLPACCRRLGAHHCAMRMSDASRMPDAATMADAASGKAGLRAPATCPSLPDYAAATTSAPYALTALPVSLPGLLAQRHSPAAGRAAARLSQIRTRSGRAPPAASLA
jgi:hypothetical protein